MSDNERDDKTEKKAVPPRPSGRSRLHRLLRFTVWITVGILALLVAAGGGALLFLRSDTGGAWLTRTVNDTLRRLPDGLTVSVDSVRAPLPSGVILSGIRLGDGQGLWLSTRKAELRLDWSTLPQALTAELALDEPSLLRLPELPSSAPEEEKSAAMPSPEVLAGQMKDLFRSWPGLLPELRVGSLTIRQATIPASVAGTEIQASLKAAASLGPDGADLSLELSRDHGSSLPVTLHASLSPQLDLLLQAEGSDLGLAVLLPDTLGRNTDAVFSLSGGGNPELWKAGLAVRLQDTGTQKDILSASAETTLRMTGTTPQGSVALKLESGPSSEKFWTLTGQKTGTLRASLDLNAKQGEGVNTTAAVELADMEWTEPMLSALLGPSCTLKASGSGALDRGTVNVELPELSFQAAHMRTLARGSLRIPESTPLLSPSAEVTMHAACSLDNAGDVSPDFSGGAHVTGDVSGTLSNLNAALVLKGDQLRFSGRVLENMEARLDVPHADIPRLAAELPRLAESTQKGLFGKIRNSSPSSETTAAPSSEPAPEPRPVLSGSINASMRINGQKTLLESLWNLEERKEKDREALRLSLDRFSLQVENNGVDGHLCATIPFTPASQDQGTVAAWLGLTPPAIDGELNVRIRQWATLASVSGLKLSGSPLNMTLNLASAKQQTLSWKGSLDSFRLLSPQGTFSLSGMKTDLALRNIWGRPEISLSAALGSLNMPGLSLSRVSAGINGNEKGVRASLQSNGDIRSDILAQWTPKRILLEKLSVGLRPSLLGLAVNSTVDIRLEEPASFRYHDRGLSTPGLTLVLSPSGRLSLSGAWSPDRVHVTADISHADLGQLRSLYPELPAGSLNCHASLDGSLQKPVGNFKLNLNNIRLPGSSLPPVSADLSGRLNVSGKRRMLSLDLDIPEETGKVLGLTESLFRLEVPFTSPSQGMSAPDMSGPLRGTMAFSGELGPLWNLLPLTDQRLSGKMDMTASISGTPSAPVLTLHAALDNGRFADLMQGVELRNIRLRADADGLNMVRRSGGTLTFTASADDSRKGKVSLQGRLDPSDMTLSVNGTIDHLSPLHRRDINIMLSGSLGVSGSVNAPSVTADITVERGQIELARLPGGDIVTLPIEEPGQKPQQPSVPLQGTLNVRVHIPNQFFIRGYGLECEWKGDIRARGPFARPGITGSIQAVRGGLDVLGKHFKLAEGHIRFDGGWPVSPLLDIVMEYDAADITADITVSGPATKPELALSSQPVMPQDEIISQIMFGQSAGTLSHVQAIQLAAGAAELAGLGGSGVMGIGRRIFGLDVLKLNSENVPSDDGGNDTSKTSLEMGTYVRENIYVGVEQGLGRESETDAVVEIELTPSLDAQVKASSNRTEFGLEWKKNY